ncbi:unnamed protein product [Bursaphelenchus xylophilus]|uniref:(pine wood nematode) hypothetical protein n=1 Tax=Bursaphelenchus xylophilus TaxID=6326 RepID=A0A1I7RHM9_BURXY|nr:unnamed protein product [Bursaphelenchus xylophilus]CAG9115577.1 unnamed protein product [Bursaphelenchus xylophilus]
MVKFKTVLCFLSSLVIIGEVFSRVVLLHNNKWNPHYGNPGVKLRLTQRGAEHVKNVGVKLLNEKLATLEGFHVQHAFSQPGLEGYIYVNDIKTLAFQPPQASRINFAAPSFIIFSIENTAISLAGRFLGVAGAGVFQVPGQVSGHMSGMSVSLTTSFRATPDGLMSVNVVNCSTVIQQSNFVLNPEGPLSTIVKTFEAQINDVIRQRIPSIFCKGLQDIIEKNSPNLFRRLATAQLQEHFQGFNSSEVIESFIRRFTHGLYIDGSNIADPIVTNEFFETQQRGELRYNDSQASAPFYPPPIPQDNDSDRMLYLYGSEYTLNSLLYHAYQSDKLTIKIEQKTLSPQFKGFVRTTCDAKGDGKGDLASSICVGILIPKIAEAYPNTTTKFVLLPHGLPEMRFTDGVSSMDLRTRILTYVDDNGVDRQILVSSADGLADIKLMAEDGRFSGDLKLRKLNVRLHRSGISGVEPDSIAQLAPLAKTFLGPQLAKGLKQGLPYPLKDSITFIDPKLTLQDGYVRLATDFELGESNLRSKVFEAFERIKNSQ